MYQGFAIIAEEFQDLIPTSTFMASFSGDTCEAIPVSQNFSDDVRQETTEAQKGIHNNSSAAMPLMPLKKSRGPEEFWGVQSPGFFRQAVVTGKRPYHFTLPLVEVKSGKLSGHVHASWTHQMLILLCRHVRHMGFAVLWFYDS